VDKLLGKRCKGLSSDGPGWHEEPQGCSGGKLVGGAGKHNGGVPGARRVRGCGKGSRGGDSDKCERSACAGRYRGGVRWLVGGR
jgi:hypothetical protein